MLIPNKTGNLLSVYFLYDSNTLACKPLKTAVIYVRLIMASILRTVAPIGLYLRAVFVVV